MFSPSSDGNPCFFTVRVILGAIWGSFPLRDHLHIICGPGLFAVLGSFADPGVQNGERRRADGRRAIKLK